jgi:intraflagellar transport protein 88
MFGPGAVDQSQYDFTGVTSQPPPTAYMRTSTQHGQATARPMTSNRGAGYDPKMTGAKFDPLGQSKGAAMKQKLEMTVEDKLKDEERKIYRLVEDCAILRSTDRPTEALDKAKEAFRREKQLEKIREQHTPGDHAVSDLNYAVMLNMATMHQACGNYTEALSHYNHIIKSKSTAMVGRLRVNMGNIYYEQQKYPTAIKMYRMALDQVPAAYASVRSKIYRSIGHCFTHMHQFHDAVERLGQVVLIVIYFPVTRTH